jgi:hypothetical protein
MSGTSTAKPAPVRNPASDQPAAEQDTLDAEDEFERARR